MKSSSPKPKPRKRQAAPIDKKQLQRTLTGYAALYGGGRKDPSNGRR